MNDLLRMDYIGLPSGAEQYRGLVLDAFGVRPEAQADILSGSTVAWETTDRSRGWYWDNVAVIPRPQQAEGTLHELIHALDEIRNGSTQAFTETKRILAFQVAVYGTLERWKAHAVDCEPEMLDFLRGYYDGIAAWPGMYDMDGSGPAKKHRLGDLWNPQTVDMANIIIGEVLAGCGSRCMGMLDKGPNRLPEPMRWIYQDIFTGDVKATPYYLPDGVP